MYKLSYVLENIDEFEWSDALFLPEDEKWNLDTEGLICDPNDVENESDEVPRAAKEHNLIDALSIQDIQDIVYNAKLQKETVSIDELLEAYLYYYDNDAFIEWKFEEWEKIYRDYISDIAMEISLSKIWRRKILSLKSNQSMQISAEDRSILPQYIKDVIIDYDLILGVQVVDECEETFDDGLIFLKFYSKEFPDIISYSGNNPSVQ